MPLHGELSIRLFNLSLVRRPLQTEDIIKVFSSGPPHLLVEVVAARGYVVERFNESAARRVYFCVMNKKMRREVILFFKSAGPPPTASNKELKTKKGGAGRGFDLPAFQSDHQKPGEPQKAVGTQNQSQPIFYL